jgi:hypothetical protein
MGPAAVPPQGPSRSPWPTLLSKLIRIIRNVKHEPTKIAIGPRP